MDSSGQGGVLRYVSGLHTSCMSLLSILYIDLPSHSPMYSPSAQDTLVLKFGTCRIVLVHSQVHVKYMYNRITVKPTVVQIKYHL